MEIINIIKVLSEQDYKIARLQGGDYTFLCKTNEEEVSTIVIIDDIRFPKLADAEQCTTIAKAFENTFLLRGYKQVNTLFLILTDKPYDFKTFSDGEFVYWVGDIYSERLLSFIENDTAFDSIRQSVESALSTPDKKSFSIKNRSLRSFLSKPLITVTLLLLNILIFLYMDIFASLEEKALLLLNYANISTVTFEQNQFYRLITCTFLHADISHLLGNMLSLFVVGIQLESVIGHIKLTILYLISGLGASICSLLYYNKIEVISIAIGASGAVFGLIGAYITLILLGRIDKRDVSISRIFFAVAIMLYSGMQQGSIDNAAHFGGIIIGSLIAYIYCICSKNKI